MSQLKRLMGSSALPVLLLVCLDLSVYHYFLLKDAAGQPKLVAHWDFAYAYFPWFVYLSDVLRAGSWPLWCPYVACGTPFFINPGTALYSPITWLVTLTVGYSEYVAQVQYTFAIVVAALGAFALARPLGSSRWGAFVSGACFGLSSAVYGNFQHGGFLNAYALMPWVFYWLYRLLWEGDRRALVGLAIVYYFLIVCSAVFVVINIVFWSLVWSVLLVRRAGVSGGEQLRRLGGMATTGLLSLVVTTIFWLPLVHFLGEITRGKPLTPLEALHGGNIQVQHLLGLVFNFMTLRPLPGYNPDVAMLGIYVGGLALPLVVIALARGRDAWTIPLLLFTLICLGMALGEEFLPSVWLHELIPAFNYSRFPAGDNRTLFALGMVLMAGRGWTTLETGDAGARKVGLVAVGLLLVTLVAGWWVLQPLYPQASFDQLRPFLFGQILLTAAAWPACWASRRASMRAVYLVLLAADLALGFRANLFVAGEAPAPDFNAKLDRLHQPSFPLAAALVPRVKAPIRWRTPAGASSDASANEGYISKRFYVAEYNPLRLRRLDGLIAAGMQPYLENGARVAFWPGAKMPTSVHAFRASVQPVEFKLDSYLPNSVAYTVKANQPGLLVFNEIYFPGWRARVDGQDVAMVPLLDGLRALPVVAGSHSVETYFHPDIFYQARRISLVGLALQLSWLLWMWRRRRPLTVESTP